MKKILNLILATIFIVAGFSNPSFAQVPERSRLTVPSSTSTSWFRGAVTPIDCSAPTFSFTGNTNTGVGYGGTGIAAGCADGVKTFLWRNGAVDLRSDSLLRWASDTAYTTTDLVLARDAANTLAQRNGTVGQAFNIYGTYTNAANYQRLYIAAGGGSSAEILQTHAGTGVARFLRIGTAGTGASGLLIHTDNFDRWHFSSAGHFLAITDNTYDIGASGAERPRNGYFGSGLFAQSFTASGVVAVAKIAESQIRIPGDGLVQLTNNAATGFTRLILGTNDANGVAIGKSGTTMQFLLGDGSNYALTQAGEYKAFGSTHFSSNATTGTLVSGIVQSINNAAIHSLGQGQGLLVVQNATDGQTCLLSLTGGNAPIVIADPSGTFSVTAGTPARVNIYWSAGNARYELQNNLATGKNFIVVRLGV